MAALQFIRVKPPHQLYPLWEIWLKLLGVTMTCQKEYWIAVSFHQTCTVFGDRWVFNWELDSKDSYQKFPFYSWENMDIGIKMSASFWMESFPKPCQIFMVTCFLPFLVYTGILVCDMNTNSYYSLLGVVPELNPISFTWAFKVSCKSSCFQSLLQEFCSHRKFHFW
mgnify:CR=1 FL=1